MLIKIALLIGAFQGAVLLIPLLRYRNNRGPNRILAALIGLLVADLLLVFLNNSEIVRLNPRLFDLNASLPFLFTPLIYFYICAITGKITKFRPIYLLHALPFLAHATYMALAFHSLPDSTRLGMISANLAAGRMIDRKMLAQGSPAEYAAWLGGLGAIALCYYAAMAKRVIEYREDLANFYSDLKHKIYGFLILSICISLCIWVLVAAVIAAGGKNQVLPMILYAIAMYVATYKLVATPELFSGNRAMAALKATPAPEAGPKRENALRAFEEEVASSRAYLDPEITIGDICGRIGLPVHQASKALNACLKKNFYQFINEYRIEEAKRMLADQALADRSVLAIAMASGFNSKSTFNEAFKKSTGLTPSEFRETVRKDASIGGRTAPSG